MLNTYFIGNEIAFHIVIIINKYDHEKHWKFKIAIKIVVQILTAKNRSFYFLELHGIYNLLYSTFLRVIFYIKVMNVLRIPTSVLNKLKQLFSTMYTWNCGDIKVCNMLKEIKLLCLRKFVKFENLPDFDIIVKVFTKSQI